MLKIYNTYTRKLEEFKPKSGLFGAKAVSFYSCGPTVYNSAHLGNLRKYINDDIVVRTLKFLGYKVKHVTNITDVGHLVSDADEGEDKMVKALHREGLDFSVDSMLKIADRYTQEYFIDLKDLNILDSDIYPRATEHVKEIMEIVEDLIKKGYAYETSTAYYFDTTKFSTYSKLGNLTEHDDHGRIEEDAEKKHPHDFSVWMKAVGKNANHVMTWDFRGQKGFPGWHIECSAMAIKHLGKTIDLHSGGVDLIKVHHTNEIAQSETYTGKQFVRYWLHGEFLNLSNGKMSKSGENFITIQALKEKGFDPLAFRFLILQAHYRSPVNFSWEALEAAQKGLNNLRQSVFALGSQVGNTNREYAIRFQEALSDDFNTAKSIAALFELLKNAMVTNADKKATILDFDEVLGLDLKDYKPAPVPGEILELANQRLIAKQNKNFELSDKLRKEIEGKGWTLKDLASGFEITKKSDH